MKKSRAATVVLFAAGVAGCQTADSPHSPTGEAVQLDKTHLLMIGVEGVQPGNPTDVAQYLRNQSGEPIHRSLEDGHGKVLFTYDLQVAKSEPDGTFTFLLKPAGAGPTFAATRKVTLQTAGDTARIELMEQPGTGRKIADVFRVQKFEFHDMSFGEHLLAAHNRFFKWVHGQ
jgi:hypothetical protein